VITLLAPVLALTLLPQNADAITTSTADWQCVAQHESGGDYAHNRYQFIPSTWEWVTGQPYPADWSTVPAALQDAAALALWRWAADPDHGYGGDGFGPWSTWTGLREGDATEQRNRRPGDSGSARFGDFWTAEPDVGRMAYGVPARVDRLRTLGNAVVPQVAELVGRMILDEVPA
jgi:hypothetical protein